MGFIIKFVFPFLAFLVIANVMPVSAEDNLWEEFKNLDVFKIR